jgi:hypothetical protein
MFSVNVEEGNPSPDLSGVCQTVLDFFSLDYTIRNGVLTLPCSASGQNAFEGIQHLVFFSGKSLVGATSALADAIDFKFVEITKLDAAADCSRMVVTMEYVVATLPDEKSTCAFAYDLYVSGVVENPDTSEGTAAPTAVVAGCLAGVALCLTLGYIVWRRRRTRLARRRLDHIAPRTPQHLISQASFSKGSSFSACSFPLTIWAFSSWVANPTLQAHERFFLQYAGLCEAAASQQESQDAYQRRLISVEDIQITETCLGEGFSGKVYLAHLLRRTLRGRRLTAGVAGRIPKALNLC